MLSGRGLCDELITHPEESYRLCCAVVCDLETSRMGAPYIYDISRLRVNSSVGLHDYNNFTRNPVLVAHNCRIICTQNHGTLNNSQKSSYSAGNL